MSRRLLSAVCRLFKNFRCLSNNCKHFLTCIEVTVTQMMTKSWKMSGNLAVVLNILCMDWSRDNIDDVF